GEGRRATLVTPDRALARAVTAALDRWRLTPDDSAGLPLDDTPPGRFLALTAALMAGRGDAVDLLAVLKHPLTHSGADRGPHMLRVSGLELSVLRGGGLHPDPGRIRDWAATHGHGDWAEWLIGAALGPRQPAAPMQDHVARHLDLAQALARGPGGEGAGQLWAAEAGQLAQATMRALAADAEAGGTMTALDYRDMVTAILAEQELRNPARPHADVMIWGAMEARVQGADLMILGGLNEGTWPAGDTADPWLSRALRARAGLRLPDRRTGLSAHDFQQAAASPEVWLSRAVRNAETETVPARWLNRLTNLLSGSGDEPAAALAAMRGRGAEWLARAEALDRPAAPEPPAPRPAPAPPAAVRPRQLSVTEIERLIRDPYAVYARRVLRLSPLDPLRPAADARLKGEILHDIVRQFVEATSGGLPDRPVPLLLDIAAAALDAASEWPVARHLWRAAIEKAAPAFVTGEAARRAYAEPMALETKGETVFPPAGLTLRATADRIDRRADGRLAIYDYKSGKVPSENEEKAFNQQLRLEAAMAARGAFTGGVPADTARVAYIGLGADGTERVVDLTPADIAETERRLVALWARFLDEGHGFVSRRAMQKVSYGSDYEHLARYGEWDEARSPVTVEVGR
ncbi:double-strand break repair protein AddB, partial [Rhodobacterales bacterium HKCCE2091]|nr:double-strand break repair protein AddB [Rhodobacterales bacterium HKCCE2091]